LAGGFDKIVSRYRERFGNNASKILSQAIDQAASVKHQEVLAAVLAALRDPNAEPYILSLMKDASKSMMVRAQAMYGLALLNSSEGFDKLLAMHNDQSISINERYYVTSAIAAYGERGLQTVLRLLEDSPGADETLREQQLDSIAGAGKQPFARTLLMEIVSTHSAMDVRQAALAGIRDDASPMAAYELMKLAVFSGDQVLRDDAARWLAHILGAGNVQWEQDPQALKLSIEFLRDAPLEIRMTAAELTSLWPLLPDPISDMAAWSQRPDAYAWRLAADSSLDSHLAELLNGGQADLVGLFNIHLACLKRGYSLGPLAQQALVRIASDPSMSHAGYWWLLQTSPNEVRQQALVAMQQSYSGISDEFDRVGFSRALRKGQIPGSASTFVDLLSRERSPIARAELVHGALSSPDAFTQRTVLDSIRLAAPEIIEPVLTGEGWPDPRYAFMDQRDPPEGIREYASLLRGIFSAYGRPEDIPMVRRFAANVTSPAALDSFDVTLSQSDRLDFQRYLDTVLLESIDAIQGRAHSD
jgi:hypothetical protein